MINLPDDDPEIVKLFLQFLYTGNYDDGVNIHWAIPSTVAYSSVDAINDALSYAPGVLIPEDTEDAVDDQGDPEDARGNDHLSEHDPEDREYNEDRAYDNDAASTPSEPEEEYLEVHGTGITGLDGTDHRPNVDYDSFKRPPLRPFERPPVNPELVKAYLNERNDMFLHLRLYIMGDKYDVPSLRLLARDRFYRAAEMGWEYSDTFADVVDELYSSTPETEAVMREIVCRLVGSRMGEKPVRDKMVVVMQKHDDFAVDVFNYILQHHSLADIVDKIYSSTTNTEADMRDIVCRCVGGCTSEKSAGKNIASVIQKHSRFAADVLSYVLPHHGFADVIDELYDSTPNTETVMHEIMCRFVGACIGDESFPDKTVPLKQKHGDFAVGVLNSILQDYSLLKIKPV